MNILGWHSIIFTAIFVLMAVGFITLLFSRSTYTKIKSIPFAFANGFGVTAWLAALVYTHYVQDIFLAHRLAFSGTYILVVGMLGLALTFPNSPVGKRFKLVLVLDMVIGAVCIGLILFTDQILTAANFIGAKPVPFSLLGNVYLLLLAAHLVASIVIFVRRYVKEVRNRLYFNYIVLAFTLFFLIAVTTNIILPLAGYVDLALVGPLSALLPFITVVYALGITDINDIEYVVAQLLRVGVRLIMLFGLFVVGLLLQRVLGLPYYSSLWTISMMTIAALGVIAFYFFGSAFDKYIEDTIAYARLSPDKARSKLIVGLSGEIELDRTASLVLRLVKQTIGVRAAGMALIAKDGTLWTAGELTLPEPEVAETSKLVTALQLRRRHAKPLIDVTLLPEAVRGRLEARGINAVMPLHTKSGIAGLYLLGDKFSQEVFTRQDATLMHAMAEIGDLSIERALFYNQIQTFNATLQQRVDSATKRLRTANNRLQTLDAMKDDFISMASHQLRSPAAAVHDAIKMLEQPYLAADERQKIIELADASSERLLSVITDMLSVARIQAGHFAIEKTAVDLAELAERALLQASGLAAEKGITAHLERPGKPVRVMADRAKMNEIMANYIENGIKYSPERSQLRVSVRQQRGRTYFEVIDQGIGVPKAERKNLFNKFHRAPNARTEHPNGNGIGLFVVRTVVEAHGGRVHYQPLSGGSLFGFWIPSE